MKKSNIVNLYRHNIVHKNIKLRQPKLCFYSFLICVVFAFLFVYMCNVNMSIDTSVKAFNPISELYREVDVALFVDSANVNFIVPIKTDSYILNNDNIEFKVSSSIMVYAPANGVIESISNGYDKVIKIKHSDKLFSIIKNVDIVGVKVGDCVKQGMEIATAKPERNIILTIVNDGKNVEGLYLSKSYIKWKSN